MLNIHRLKNKSSNVRGMYSAIQLNADAVWAFRTWSSKRTSSGGQSRSVVGRQRTINPSMGPLGEDGSCTLALTLPNGRSYRSRSCDGRGFGCTRGLESRFGVTVIRLITILGFWQRTWLSGNRETRIPSTRPGARTRFPVQHPFELVTQKPLFSLTCTFATTRALCGTSKITLDDVKSGGMSLTSFVGP